MRAGTQGPTRPSVYFSCLSLKWLQGPGLCSQASSPAAAREGTEDSVIQGRWKEARTSVPQRALVGLRTPGSKHRGQASHTGGGRGSSESAGGEGRGAAHPTQKPKSSLSVKWKHAHLSGGRITNILPRQASRGRGLAVQAIQLGRGTPLSRACPRELQARRPGHPPAPGPCRSSSPAWQGAAGLHRGRKELHSTL